MVQQENDRAGGGADRPGLGGPGHTAARDVLRVAGPLVAGLGLVLTVIGFVSFFSTFASFGSLGPNDFGPPRYFWCAFAGMPLLFVGLILSLAGFGGAVQRYMAGESAPVARDTFNYLSHGTRDGVRDLASAVGSGLAEGLGGAAGVADGATGCPQCGKAVPGGARFCPDCGAGFVAKPCAACGSPTVPGATFCHHCGAPMGVGGVV